MLPGLLRKPRLDIPPAVADRGAQFHERRTSTLEAPHLERSLGDRQSGRQGTFRQEFVGKIFLVLELRLGAGGCGIKQKTFSGNRHCNIRSCSLLSATLLLNKSSEEMR